MNSFVVDCSVTSAWCLPDETSHEATRHLNSLVTARGLVPAMWVYEMANALNVARRRGRLTPDGVEVALGLLRRLPLLVDPCEFESLERVRELASRTSLTAYHASYLDLAMTFRIPLATLDGALQDAAREHGVELL